MLSIKLNYWTNIVYIFERYFSQPADSRLQQRTDFTPSASFCKLVLTMWDVCCLGTPIEEF